MTKYIDKDALIAKIEKCYNECLKRAKITDSDYWNAKADAYRNVLVIFDDTIEVKEVDFKKEISNYIDTYYKDAKIGLKLSIKRTAKLFFELGLKAQKGE